jgi:sugar/nucleoside kinase (ribokinase family)
MQFYESKVAERIVWVEGRAMEPEHGREAMDEGSGKGGVDADIVRLLHTEGYWIPQLLPHIKRARELGWLTSIDLDGLSAEWQNPQGLMQIAQCFDIVFMNRGTATAVWPDIPRDGAWLPAVEGRLMQIASGKHSASGTYRQMPLHKSARGKLSGAIVLTLGEDGALLVPREGAPVRIEGVRVRTVDTTGAGDVFAGTFLAIWLNRGSLDVAGRYACVAAALSTTGRGALGYLPTAENILSFVPSQLEPVCGADESVEDRSRR